MASAEAKRGDAVTPDTASAGGPLQQRYVESSALVAAFIEGDARAKKALRARGRRIARRTELVAVSDDILARAGRPFAVEPVRTLDAVHLATVEAITEVPELVTIVTCDSRIAENARAIGYVVEP